MSPGRRVFESAGKTAKFRANAKHRKEIWRNRLGLEPLRHCPWDPSGNRFWVMRCVDRIPKPKHNRFVNFTILDCKLNQYTSTNGLQMCYHKDSKQKATALRKIMQAIQAGPKTVGFKTERTIFKSSKFMHNIEHERHLYANNLKKSDPEGIFGGFPSAYRVHRSLQEGRGGTKRGSYWPRSTEYLSIEWALLLR